MPYGADSLRQGTECGPETKRRLDRVARLVAGPLNGVQCTIFLGAGLNKNEPSFSCPLKKKMETYLNFALKREQRRRKDRGKTAFIMPEIVLVKADAWGTLPESVVVAEELKARGIFECYVVSSWYHIPRIMFIWSRMKAFNVHTVCAWAFPFKNVLTEWYKLLGTMLFRKKRIPDLREKEGKKNVESQKTEFKLSPIPT